MSGVRTYDVLVRRRLVRRRLYMKRPTAVPSRKSTYCILYFLDSFVNILLIGRFYFHFEADLDISTGYQIIQKFFQKYKSHYDVQKISRKTEKFQESLTHEKTICRSSGPYGRKRSNWHKLSSTGSRTGSQCQVHIRIDPKRPKRTVRVRAWPPKLGQRTKLVQRTQF